jgi:hypothetical protein
MQYVVPALLLVFVCYVSFDILGLVDLDFADLADLDIPAVLVSFHFVLLPVSVRVYPDDLVLQRVFDHSVELVDPVSFLFVVP